MTSTTRISMLWLFGGSEKQVSKEEFRERVIPRLRSKGFSDEDIQYVRAVIDASLNEEGGQKGVSEKEVERLAEILDRNAPGHFSDENLKKLIAELNQCL